LSLQSGGVAGQHGSQLLLKLSRQTWIGSSGAPLLEAPASPLKTGRLHKDRGEPHSSGSDDPALIDVEAPSQKRRSTSVTETPTSGPSAALPWLGASGLIRIVAAYTQVLLTPTAMSKLSATSCDSAGQFCSVAPSTPGDKLQLVFVNAVASQSEAGQTMPNA